MSLRRLSIRRGSSTRPAAMRALSIICSATKADTLERSASPCAWARAMIIGWLGLISNIWGGRSACLLPGFDWFYGAEERREKREGVNKSGVTNPIVALD